MPRKRLTDLDREKIRELAAAGLSPNQVAKELGWSCSAMCRAFDRLGLPRKRTTRHHILTEEDVTACARLYFEDGLTLAEIAQKFSSHATTVRYRLIKAGHLDFRPSGAPPRFTDPTDKQSIIEQYENGFSTNFLSTKLKCSPDAINKVLEDAGVKRRTQQESVGLRWTDTKGREHLMRSSWEVCTAQWFDDQGLQWDYELKSFVLDDDGKRRRYTPDFWVYRAGGSVEQIIEVKGWMSESCEHRISLFRQDHPDLPFEIWEETDLQERGILDVEIRRPPVKIKFAGSPTRMSNKERLGAMNLFDGGMSYANIAEELQRGSSTVSSFLHSTGRVTTKAASNRGRVPQETRDRMVTLYKELKAIDKVAAALDVSRDIVYGELKRRGVVNQRPRGRVSQDALDRGVELYKQGSTIAEAAKSSDTSYHLLREELKRLGLLRARGDSKKSRCALTDEQAQNALSRNQAGERMKEIAVSLGVSRPTLRSAIKRLH